jgi:hypothetical protein
MNGIQRILILGAVLALIATTLAIPFRCEWSGIGVQGAHIERATGVATVYAPFFDLPATNPSVSPTQVTRSDVSGASCDTAELNTGLLALWWGAIVVLAGAGAMIFKTKPGALANAK